MSLLLLISACSTPPSLDRATFNRRAAEAALPLFWREGTALEPPQLAVTWPATRETYVKDGTFTPAFEEALRSLSAQRDDVPRDARRAALLEELRTARPALVSTDLGPLTPGEVGLVQAVSRAALKVEVLYRRQRGAEGVTPADDPESQAVYQRNQGPWCEAASTRLSPECHATVPATPRISGLYPASLAAQAGFCERLPPTLLDPYAVVVAQQGTLVEVPYTQVWGQTMEDIAKELDGAASGLGSEEEALRSYLSAAAAAFRSNDWRPADEAWSRMNATNSRWYLRIGPDEVQSDPCGLHAVFHVSFARINQDSLRWQRLLSPLKKEMETAVAALAGPPYVARDVNFQLPDFINIVLNAGDSRAPAGATIGQSLPNWGPVAEEGRGRTVAMTNIGQDPDSLASLDRQARTLLCDDALPDWTTDPEPELVSTILHEASHNLGPTGSWRVDGRSDVEAMGGPTAGTMEELKAQTGAMYLMDWLVTKGVVDPELGRRVQVGDLIWMFSQIAEGMFDADHPLPYAQLSAVQLGVLLDQKALIWRSTEPAANGQDIGCFSIDRSQWGAGVAYLARAVFGLKARNDAPAANALLKQYVQGDAEALLTTIGTRIRREPRPVYVYELRVPF